MHRTVISGNITAISFKISTVKLYTYYCPFVLSFAFAISKYSNLYLMPLTIEYLLNYYKKIFPLIFVS